MSQEAVSGGAPTASRSESVSIKSHIDLVSRNRIAGWVLDTSRPSAPLTVRLVVNGQEMMRAVADLLRPGLTDIYGSGNHGFDFRLPTPLSPESQHHVSLRLLEGTRLLYDGFIVPEPRTAPPPRHGHPEVVLLSSTGRSGTTVMMRHFNENPHVVVAGDAPFEVKLLTYASHAIRTITTPKDNEPRPFADIRYDLPALEPNPYFGHLHAGVFRDPDALYDLFGRVTTDRLSRAFHDIVTTFYARLAADQENSAALYFAEKCDILSGLRDTVRRMFSVTREILLVRDLRDVYCSSKSFWKVDRKFLSANLSAASRSFLAIKRENRTDVIVVRYEDLMSAPGKELDRISGFLGLPTPLAEVNDLALFSSHGTSANPTTSVGRWRNALSDEEAAEFKSFAEFFEEFGYEPPR